MKVQKLMSYTIPQLGNRRMSLGLSDAPRSKVSHKPISLAIHLSLFLFFMVFQVFGLHNQQQPSLTELRARGFSLIPSPQQITLGPLNIIIDDTWRIDSKIGKKDIAYTSLIEKASELHQLRFSSNGTKKIILAISVKTITGNGNSELNKQGYLLKIMKDRVEITGNSKAGLFYGVQSFLQLLQRNHSAQLILPECEIRDWPSLQYRFVHWDTKHHQKRIKTLKRLIDWHAFFKVNMIAFEIEDKYEYPTHPIIGAPGAYTKSEMQEITKYALERHIQLVPNVQSPAHMAYVLKHKEMEHLRSDNSNYQACMCDPNAIKLIFDMYQDMIDATPGVDFFLVSSDEVYYAGICDKCKDPYNAENRSLAWAEFAIKAHDWLAKRNRMMIAWIEYPLMTKDIHRLPPDIINGVMGNNKEYLDEQRKIGMRQLAYSSTQGAELLFPNHFSSTDYKGKEVEGRLEQISQTVVEGIKANADPIGTIAAAWDDAGLHEETFHLGWATVTQYGWTPNFPTPEQNVADFMDVFYGANSPDMKPIYDALIEGARFFERGWDIVQSKERKTGYGNSYGKGVGGNRKDRILSLPEIPSENSLLINPNFNKKYKSLIYAAKRISKSNKDLRYKLNRYISKVERNQYNLEVFLSIANLENYFIKTIITLSEIELLMIKAEKESSDQPAISIANLTKASIKAKELIDWGDWMWENLENTWKKSRHEKNRSLAGRDFVHVMDDVKDHFADRRIGLDYMIAPFQRLDLPGWRNKLNEIIKKYATANNLEIKELKEIRLED